MISLANKMNRKQPEHLDFKPLDWESVQENEIIERIQASGIVGMGGAGYPTHLKIEKSRHHAPCTVVANGVECEPGVTADETLMQCHPKEILEGMRIVARYLGTDELHIVLGSSQSSQKFDSLLHDNVKKHVLKKTASNGEERILIQQVLDIAIPRSSYPADFGILILNVATFFAIYEAVCIGRKPHDRMMTINGRNEWVPVGDRIENTIGRSVKVRAGGPYSGMVVASSEPTALTMNGLFNELPSKTQPCIRCGVCTDVCPIHLPVEAMYLTNNTVNLLTQYADDFERCFECGACAEACPSDIPLLDHIRDGRSALRRDASRAQKTDITNQRFETRIQRIDQVSERTEKEREDRVKAERTW